MSEDNSNWDANLMKYTGRTLQAEHDNICVKKFLDVAYRILDSQPDITATDLYEAVKRDYDNPRKFSFGQFLSQLINDMRDGKNNKRPSRNYQNYVNLLHKLEDEGHIINVPVSQINNSHLIRFSDYVLKNVKGNYIPLMKLFKQTHKKAYVRELNDNVLRFNYSDYAPMTEDKEKAFALTKEEYEAFKNIDLDSIPVHAPHLRYYYDLYHDFCVMLYETMMRPVDVIKLHSSNIVRVNGRGFIKYVPEKKKNFRGRDKVTYTPINETAMGIIKKYEGRSKQQYVFPLGINDHKWDFEDAASWNNWNNRKQKTLCQINFWLTKVNQVLKVPGKITLYTFRHSALSHACAEDSNYMRIALNAATSPDMLLKHYVSNFL